MRKAWIVPLLLIIGLVATVGWIIRAPRQQSFLPAELAGKITFTVYAPKTMPTGFSLKTDSLRYQEGVLLLDITSPIADEPLVVSEQARPQDFKFEDFYKDFFGSTKTTNELGELVVGTVRDQTIASLLTDTTWVLITGSKNIEFATVSELAKSLAPVN